MVLLNPLRALQNLSSADRKFRVVRHQVWENQLHTRGWNDPFSPSGLDWAMRYVRENNVSLRQERESTLTKPVPEAFQLSPSRSWCKLSLGNIASSRLALDLSSFETFSTCSIITYSSDKRNEYVVLNRSISRRLYASSLFLLINIEPP